MPVGVIYPAVNCARRDAKYSEAWKQQQQYDECCHPPTHPRSQQQQQEERKDVFRRMWPDVWRLAQTPLVLEDVLDSGGGGVRRREALLLFRLRASPTRNGPEQSQVWVMGTAARGREGGGERDRDDGMMGVVGKARVRRTRKRVGGSYCVNNATISSVCVGSHYTRGAGGSIPAD